MGEHDLLFKRVFRVPAHAAGELSAVLPKEVLAALDPGSLALVEGDEQVDRWLSERFRDALFRASFRGVPGYIWFLVEHQSEPDEWMVLRAVEYLVRSWVELVRIETERKTLPPVVCVIVHHGEGGWNAPTRLHELVDGIAEVPELRGLVPDFRIIVDDLVKQPDEELKRRPLPAFPKVVLWMLRDIRTIERFLERVEIWGEELRRLSAEAPEDMATISRYMYRVVGDEWFERVKKRIIEVAPATEQIMGTAAERLIQEGERKGEAKGKAEGKAEGEAKGKADAVLAIFETRKKKVTAEERARITGCQDIAELDRWLRKAVTAESVAELFSH